MNSFSHFPTPVEHHRRLAEAIGLSSGELLIKRDDLSGSGVGGNKVRKLLAFVAEARRLGCDTLVTGGGTQSNHARTTAAVAAACGLACELVLSGPAPTSPVGNVLLDVMFGASITWLDGPLRHTEAEEAILTRASEVEALGRRPLAIPLGGANALGTATYQLAVDEVNSQVKEVDLHVVAGGTGGTAAGLVCGCRDFSRVLAVDVGARPDLAAGVGGLVEQCCSRLGVWVPSGEPRVLSGQVGDAYALPTQQGAAAASLVAKLSGLVLDPVYTSKAFAGLIQAIEEGEIPPSARVMFWHTGGLPAVFVETYSGWASGSLG